MHMDNDGNYYCKCGKKFERLYDMEDVYDDMGIYAGRWCSYECADKNMLLHNSYQHYAETGEAVEPDDY